MGNSAKGWVGGHKKLNATTQIGIFWNKKPDEAPIDPHSAFDRSKFGTIASGNAMMNTPTVSSRSFFRPSFGKVNSLKYLIPFDLFRSYKMAMDATFAITGNMIQDLLASIQGEGTPAMTKTR